MTAAPQDGLMMEVEMTGRTALPQPMMMQPVLLFARKYRFSGRYMSDRVRTDEGLVWALRCAAGGERFAQTAAMKDTERKWESFKRRMCGAGRMRRGGQDATRNDGALGSQGRDRRRHVFR